MKWIQVFLGVFALCASAEPEPKNARQLYSAFVEAEPGFGNVENFVRTEMLSPEWVWASNQVFFEEPAVRDAGEKNWNTYWAEVDRRLVEAHPLVFAPLQSASESLRVALRPSRARLYTHQEADVQARNELGLGDRPLRDDVLKYRFNKRVIQLMEQENPLRRNGAPDVQGRFARWKTIQGQRWEQAAAEMHRQLAITLVRDLGFKVYLAENWISSGPNDTAHSDPKFLSSVDLEKIDLSASVVPTDPVLKGLAQRIMPGSGGHPWSLTVLTDAGPRKLIVRPPSTPEGTTFGYGIETLGGKGLFERMLRPKHLLSREGDVAFAMLARVLESGETLREAMELLEESKFPQEFQRELGKLQSQDRQSPDMLVQLGSNSAPVALLWSQGKPEDWIGPRDRRAKEAGKPSLLGSSAGGNATDFSSVRGGRASNTSRDQIKKKQTERVFSVHGSYPPTYYGVPPLEERRAELVPWKPTQNPSTVHLQAERFFSVVGNRLAVLSPEGMELVDVEAWDRQGKKVTPGNGLAVLQVPGRPAWFLECEGCDALAYRAGYAPRAEGRETLPPKLKNLNRAVLKELAAEMEAEGFTAAARRLKSLLWWRTWTRVSVEDVARAFRGTARYSYRPEGAQQSEGSVFSPFTAFLNEKGELCAQCDGTNGLLAVFLKEYFRRTDLAVEAEVRTFYVREGDRLSAQLHGFVKLRGLGLVGYPLDATPSRTDPRSSLRPVESQHEQESPETVLEATSRWQRAGEVGLPDLSQGQKAMVAARDELFKALQGAKAGNLSRTGGPIPDLIRLAGELERMEGDSMNAFAQLEAAESQVKAAEALLATPTPGRDKRFPVYADANVRAAWDALAEEVKKMTRTGRCSRTYRALSGD